MSDDEEEEFPLDDAPAEDKQMPGQLAVPLAEETPKRFNDGRPGPGPGGKPGRVSFPPGVTPDEHEERMLHELTSGGQTVDWPRLKRMYVEGIRRNDPGRGSYTYWPSLRDVGRLSGVTENIVRAKGSREGWPVARNQYQARVEQLRIENRAKNQARHSDAIDRAALGSASQGLALVLLRVEEIAQKQRDRRSGVAQADSDEFEVTVDGRELETLGRAAATWHALGQKVLGISETHKVQLSGPNGGPLTVQTSVVQAMREDDPDRLYGFLIAAERSGLLGPGMLEEAGIIDGETEIEQTREIES